MVQRNQLLYILNVKVRESLTDTRAVEFMKSWDFYLNDWTAFVKEATPFYNPIAERIIRFFISFDKFDICPDLYGECEPPKTQFDTRNIVEPISYLAFPAGTLIMKKRNSFDVVIRNGNHGCSFWEKDNYKVFRPIKELGEFLGNIQFSVKMKNSNYSIEQMKTIVADLCKYLDTDYGTITIWDNYIRKDIEILYQYQNDDDRLK